MHLGLLVYGSLETVSGGYLYDRKLVEHFKSCGDELEVISVPWRPYGRALLDNFSPALFKRLRQASFQVLLQDELVHPSFFWLNGRLKSALPYPIISLVQHLRSCETHPPSKHRFYRWVEKKYLDSVDGFIYVSHAIRREVESLRGGERPCVLAYPGGDHFPGSTTPCDITKRTLKSGPMEIVAVANLIPRKGLHTLIAALACLPREQWRLRVAGSLTDDPSYVLSLRQQITKQGLDRQVVLLGTLSATDLSSLFTQTHVLAVPPSFEALGIVYLEAMRAGLPVIASTNGGSCEVITHGRDGFLVSPGNVSALADFLYLFLNDRHRLLAMSLAARERSQTHPTWEDGMAKARAFLLDVVRGGIMAGRERYRPNCHL